MADPPKTLARGEDSGGSKRRCPVFHHSRAGDGATWTKGRSWSSFSADRAASDSTFANGTIEANCTAAMSVAGQAKKRATDVRSFAISEAPMVVRIIATATGLCAHGNARDSKA